MSSNRPSPDVLLHGVLLPGVGASAAYLIAMYVDRLITRNRYDDLVLWGSFFTADRGRQTRVGLAGHFSLGFVVAAVYALLDQLPEGVRARLPQNTLLRSAMFVGVEHFAGFPAVILDRYHPGVRRGDLPRLLTLRYCWLETTRHAAFALGLGLSTRRRGRDARPYSVR